MQLSYSRWYSTTARRVSLSILLLFVSAPLFASACSNSISDHNPFLPEQQRQKPADGSSVFVSKIEIPADESLSVEQLALLPNEKRDHLLLKPGLVPAELQGDVVGSSSSSQLSKGIRVRKTGTTIAGIVGRDFCIVAADTRATMGMTVADQRAEKLHFLCGQVWAAGAGTSADLQHLARACRYTFRLKQHDIGNSSIVAVSSSTATISPPQQQDQAPPSFQSVCHWLREQLYRQNGSCQANFIVGGICPKTRRPYLRAIHPHGSMDSVAFAALGSGGMAAMAVLESSYRGDGELTCEQAVHILLRAIRAGIENDLGSGSQVDLVVLHSNGPTEYQRAAVPEPELPPLDDKPCPSRDDNIAVGVNGFGNAPFVIRPVSPHQRIRKRPEDVECEWSILLGLL